MSDIFKRKWARLPVRLQVTYLLIIAVVAIGISTFLTFWGMGQIRPMAAPNQASLSISSGDQNYAVGTVFSLSIYLGADPSDQIKKIQLNSFRYDPSMVIVDNGGGQLKANPSILANLQTITNTVEIDGLGNQTGKLNLTMVNVGQSYYTDGSTRLATINFRVLRAGQAFFSFDPADGVGNGTLVNNAVDTNILISAASGTIALGPAPANPTPTPVITPVPTSSQSSQPTQSSSTTSSRSTAKNTTTGSPTITPEIISTPTETFSESQAALTGPVKLEGMFSKANNLIYVGAAAAVTLVASLVWFIRNKKRGSKGKPKEDDDELI